VTHSIPPLEIWGGVPARLIRRKQMTNEGQRDRGEPSRSDNADRDRDRDRRDGGGSSSRGGGGGGGQPLSTQSGDSGSLAERIGGVPPSLPARPDTVRHHNARESRSDREIPRKRTFQDRSGPNDDTSDGPSKRLKIDRNSRIGLGQVHEELGRNRGGPRRN